MEVQRSDIVADHIGGTAQKTEKFLNKAEGRFFFLDEAYWICSSSEHYYGKEALETIMSRINAHPSKDIQNPIFIFAGYKEMEDFLKVNPDLTRRIKTKLEFEKFSTVQLMEITKRKLLKKNIRFPHDVDGIIVDCFEKIPSQVREINNAGLCTDLINVIQTC